MPHEFWSTMGAPTSKNELIQRMNGILRRVQEEVSEAKASGTSTNYADGSKDYRDVKGNAIFRLSPNGFLPDSLYTKRVQLPEGITEVCEIKSMAQIQALNVKTYVIGADGQIVPGSEIIMDRYGGHGFGTNGAYTYTRMDENNIRSTIIYRDSQSLEKQLWIQYPNGTCEGVNLNLTQQVLTQRWQANSLHEIVSETEFGSQNNKNVQAEYNRLKQRLQQTNQAVNFNQHFNNANGNINPFVTPNTNNCMAPGKIFK